MKQLSLLILTILMSLGALPGAIADTPARTSAKASINGSVSAIPKPPAPKVVEAPNGDLDLQTLGKTDATVELTYPEIADGHTAGLYWTSSVQQYRARVQTVSGGAKRLIFKIPNATVIKDLGQSPVVTVSVGVGNNPLVISQPLTIKVINGAPPGQYAPPALPDFADNNVDIGTLVGDLKVRVSYASMATGQAVKVLWRGATSYDTPLRLPPNNTPLEFTIPHATVLASLGKSSTLSYEVTLDGQAAQTSDSIPVNVVLKTLKDAPVVPSAAQGQIDLKNLAGQPLKVTYTYPGITPGHTAGIRWAGNPVYDTPHPAIGATPRPLEFTIPYDKVRQEKDKTVLITASVGIGVGQLAVSPETSLKIVDTRPRGEDIAADLNVRYNDVRTSCDNGQPSYYCTGVTTRGTLNSTYDPWDPSPTQLRKGSISFSHIRKDSRVTQLLQNSGYALLSQEQAISQGKQQPFLCIYPHDAWTDLVGRPGAGCGFQPGANQRLINMLADNPELVTLLRSDEELLNQLTSNDGPTMLTNSDSRIAELLPELGTLLRENERAVDENRMTLNAADLSTCASVNATTPAKWNAYASKLGHPSHQCSLSTADAAQFDSSLKARQYGTSLNSPWNELLIKVWAAGLPAQLPIAAFYYVNPAGLAEARIYQQKYAAKTKGQWLPVIKLDQSKWAGNPFSYSAGDQAIAPAP